MSAVCLDDGNLAIWLIHALGSIYAPGTAAGDETLLADLDGTSQEQSWYYSPATDSDDFFSANWPRDVIDKLLKTEKVVYTIPTAKTPYVVTFDVAGLDRHIKTPEDICK